MLAPFDFDFILSAHIMLKGIDYFLSFWIFSVSNRIEDYKATQFTPIYDTTLVVILL